MESTNYPGEIGLGLLTVLLSGSLFFVVNSVLNMSSNVQNRYLELIPYTVSSEDKQITLQQDTSKFSDAQPILPSENEKTGIEFSYSFYLVINESTFDGSDVLHNVFYKGYDNRQWPLLAPGVYIKGDTNTMRIIMSSFSDAYYHLDIENIPVNKWFHVVLNFKNLALEVYVNGQLTKKLSFEESLPYFNYGNITIFSNNLIQVNRPTYGQPIVFSDTCATGKLSNLIYTRYALSYNEIQNLYKKGASNNVKSLSKTETPPYFSDSWYSSQRN
jgi:hypothetical protein